MFDTPRCTRRVIRLDGPFASVLINQHVSISAHGYFLTKDYRIIPVRQLP